MKNEYKELKRENREVFGYVICPRCERVLLKLKLYVYNRDKFTCQNCGTRQDKLSPDNYLTRHHVVAKCNGSMHKVETINNNVTWCWTCHRQYNRRHPVQKIEVLVTS